LENKAKQTLNADKKIEEKRKEIVVKKAEELVNENISTKISSLKGDINNNKTTRKSICIGSTNCS
jgi:hypothetical protein